ncbi:hypothetical protein GGR51DRAFT_145564 [Nemania sp. FL0031]|nr:hypothetical protein GGR51DRAFT_145564 [Nemania sp. FL0031]
MTTTAKAPQARLNDLTAVVSDLESGFRDKFAQWDKKGHAGPEEHFLWTYTEAINTIKLIASEKWKNENPSLSPDLDQLEARVTPLLFRSVDYIKETGFRLSRVHKGLVKALRSLTTWGNCDLQGLGTHTIHMFLRLKIIQPPPRAAWNQDASDLKPDEEFEQIFEKFVGLKKLSKHFQFKHEMFVSQSYRLLKDACEALNIGAEKAYPDERFFENDFRPTYVEYPYGSQEFTYGKGTRPGILSLKSSFGMPLSAKETRRLQRAREEKPQRRQPKTKSRKGITKKKRRTTSKKVVRPTEQRKEKRKRVFDQSQSLYPSKKPHLESGYTMNAVNAAADIEDILRDNKYTDVKTGDVNRPDSQRLVTPPVEIRKVTLVAYREDMRRIIDEIFKRKFGTPTSKAKLPQTAAARSDWLARAEKEIAVARAEVEKLVESVNSPAQGKLIRLAAYRLRLVRAIYTLGLVSGEPAASDNDVKEGLKDRLRDWILYERAWLAAEWLTLKRAGISDELYSTISEQNTQRRKNIRQWKQMLKSFDEQPGSLDTEAIQATGVTPTIKTELLYDLGSELEDEVDPEVTLVEELSEPEKAETVAEDAIYFPVKLTDEEVTKANLLLDRALSPRRPGSSSFMLDVSKRRRQRNWFENMKRPTVKGQPLSPWPYEESASPLTADGPPGWELLPTKTVWDRFQYMWVLTYWRFFQLRLLEK